MHLSELDVVVGVNIVSRHSSVVVVFISSPVTVVDSWSRINIALNMILPVCRMYFSEDVLAYGGGIIAALYGTGSE